MDGNRPAVDTNEGPNRIHGHCPGDRSASRNHRRDCESLSMRETVMSKQAMRQAAMLAASQVQAKLRRKRAQRDRRLEKLAIEVLTPPGERDAMPVHP